MWAVDLKRKTVLVTGGGSGIGLGIALALAPKGCRVAITGRDEAKLQRAAKLAGAAYAASKFAVTALGTAVSLEERANGIHVTNIYPGEVDTPILTKHPTPTPPEQLAQMLQPEDIASLVVTIAKLPPRAVVPEIVITPLYQEFA